MALSDPAACHDAGAFAKVVRSACHDLRGVRGAKVVSSRPHDRPRPFARRGRAARRLATSRNVRCKMDPPPIRREDLLHRLRVAALVRSVITLFVGMPVGLLIAMLMPAGLRQSAWTLMACLFGTPLVVGWLITTTICKRMVRCPTCSESLWACGTGNFKPRRMKVRANAHCCPHCGASIE